MDIIRVHPYDPLPALTAAIETLQAGGVVVVPTDTLYGLAANALNAKAVAKVYDIKQRARSKPLPIIARNLTWVDGLAHVMPSQRPLLEKIWPGAITVILRKKPIVPDMVSGNGTVAIRIPDHPLIDRLLAQFGYPLTATSANISGEDSSQRIDDVIAMFREHAVKPDLVIDVGTLPPSLPSTILDLTKEQPQIVRVGATNPQQLMELLKL